MDETLSQFGFKAIDGTGLRSPEEVDLTDQANQPNRWAKLNAILWVCREYALLFYVCNFLYFMQHNSLLKSSPAPGTGACGDPTNKTHSNMNLLIQSTSKLVPNLHNYRANYTIPAALMGHFLLKKGCLPLFLVHRYCYQLKYMWYRWNQYLSYWVAEHTSYGITNSV